MVGEGAKMAAKTSSIRTLIAPLMVSPPLALKVYSMYMGRGMFKGRVKKWAHVMLKGKSV